MTTILADEVAAVDIIRPIKTSKVADMNNFMDQIRQIESIDQIDEVWPKFESMIQQIGLEFVIYTISNRDRTEIYYYDSLGIHPKNDDQLYDPFLEYCCHSYDITYTGREFLADYPFLDPEAISLIKRGGELGMISGIGIPIRLIGSERFGGFNLGSRLEREPFLDQFASEVNSLRLMCLMVQRHIETLMDNSLPRNESILTGSNGKSEDFVDVLTKRESEVLSIISNGYSRKACAYMLKVSEATISTHTKNIYRKLGVNNRVEAARTLISSIN